MASATWLASPGTGDFNTASNWDPATVPTNTATFGTSAVNTIQFSANTTVDDWRFNAGASDYTFNLSNFTLFFIGDGIDIDGGSATINANAATITFFNASSAGDATIINGLGDGTALGFNNLSTAGSANITNNSIIAFNDLATAGTATITNNFQMFFDDESSAGSANITITDGASRLINFTGSSTAGSATITNNESLTFTDNSTAGSATIINNDTLRFFANSTAGGAEILTNSGATTTFFTTGPGGTNQITAGSIAGGGDYNLSTNELTVGSNDLSTEVSGIISSVTAGAPWSRSAPARSRSQALTPIWAARRSRRVSSRYPPTPISAIFRAASPWTAAPSRSPARASIRLHAASLWPTAAALSISSIRATPLR